MYQHHENNLGTVLDAVNQKGLKRYRELMGGLIRRAVAQDTPAECGSMHYVPGVFSMNRGGIAPPAAGCCRAPR